MNEYSTIEHVLQVHDNHSEHLSINSNDGHGIPVYKHVEHIKASASMIPVAFINVTDVHCSPKFSLHLRLSQFINAYRMFHSTLFAICIFLVLILYAFIYNAVYQRRVTRTRKLSAYRRIIRSYLMNNEPEHTETQSSKNTHHRHHHHHHHHRHRHEHLPSTLTLICCYCCRTSDDYTHELQRPSESACHEPLNERRRQPHHHHHIQDEPSSMMINENKNKPKVVLEVNGSRRGKRYSAISMTSMTYLTSGVWDET
jgi:hypothetical protein